MAVQQTSLHNLARLFRTARHLRLSQLYFRIVRVLRRRYERTALGRRRYQSRGVPPSDVVALRNPLQESRARRCLEEGGAYRFLNVTLETHGSWFPSGASDLWLFNLHYFDYVFEIKDDAVFQDLVLDWIERVPICHPLAWS
ncbi:MAG: hypothetical protein GX589_09535, partial [Deltaproteobacteria bacterium]|nr:hypothetical protein [Deltaproteobacteria bacterium]